MLQYIDHMKYTFTHTINYLSIYVYIFSQTLILLKDINRIKDQLQYSNEKVYDKERITRYAILVTLKVH